MQFGGQFERHKPAPAQLSLWQASFWTTAYMSPQRCMQADLARSSDLNLTLYIENFIKEKVSDFVDYLD